MRGSPPTGKSERRALPDTSATREYFDRHAVRYDEIVRNVDFQLNDGYRYLADYVQLATARCDELHILELGIGTGKLTRYLLEADPRARVTGVDVSPRMLENAEHNLRNYSERLALVCGDFASKAVVDGKYDLVVSAIALTLYTIDHESLYRRVHHLLKKEGLFVYAANVAQNESAVDRIARQMLVGQLAIEKEQAQWLHDIKGGADTDIFMAPARWHVEQLQRAGFYDADCIYLRYKLGIFSAQKPGSAL